MAVDDIFRIWNLLFLVFALTIYTVQHKRMWKKLPARRKALVIALGVCLATFIEGTAEILFGVRFPARLGLVTISTGCVIWAVALGRITKDDGTLLEDERTELERLRAYRNERLRAEGLSHE